MPLALIEACGDALPGPSSFRISFLDSRSSFESVSYSESRAPRVYDRACSEKSHRRRALESAVELSQVQIGRWKRTGDTSLVKRNTNPCRQAQTRRVLARRVTRRRLQGAPARTRRASILFLSRSRILVRHTGARVLRQDPIERDRVSRQRSLF